MNVTNSRIVYINSKNRSGGTNEDFTVTLNMSQDETYDRACVLYANIPVSYYLIKSGQNDFQLKEGIDIVGIVVPPGNYTVNSFITVVTALLNTASPNHWTYSITMNNSYTNVSTGLFNYAVTGNGTLQPMFSFYNNLAEQFGFPNPSGRTFTSGTLTGEYVVNFIPESTLYLYSDLIETKDNNTTNILQEFYGENAITFSNIIYQCRSVEGYSKVIRNSFSNTINFTLLDEHGDIVDLHGQPFFVTLLLYKSNDLSDIIKKYIKYNLLLQN